MKLFSVQELADSLELDRRTALKLLAGLPAAEEAPRANGQIVRRYRLKAVFEHLTGVKTLNHQDRLIKARADLEELKLGIKRGELAHAVDVESTWTNILYTVRARLRAVPHRLAPMLVAIDDPAQLYAELSTAIDEALEALGTGDGAKPPKGKS